MLYRFRPAPVMAALALAAGCATTTQNRYQELRADFDQFAHQSAIAEEGERTDPFADAATLRRAELIAAVLERNSSLEAARQAWIQATAEVPRATALDDPSLSYSFAPLSPFDDDVRYGQVVSVGQEFPWPGTLRARGGVALAEAEAAQSEYLAARLELALAAATSFDEYYRLERALEINEIHIGLLEEAQQSARAEFESGRATLQDPLQAEVEASHLRHRQIALEAERDALIARMNALLHRDPTMPLPPPPEERPIPELIETPASELVAEALEARNEIEELDAQVRAGEAALDLAKTRYLPGVGVSATYNNMWAQLSHRLMVGFKLNVPVWQAPRRAGVDQAQARIARARALREHVSTAIAADVVAMHRRALEARHIVMHYREQILPATRDRVDAARAAFVAGELSFFAFVDALATLRMHELEYEEHLANLYRRTATLERAIGQVSGVSVNDEVSDDLD